MVLIILIILIILKGTRWIPHIHRALKVFLHHGEGKDLASDPDQYSVVLQHMEHLAASQSCSVEVQGRAKKVSLLCKPQCIN